MKTYHRNFIYESNDFECLCKFIIQDNTLKKDNFTWHIGRIMDWKYNLSNFYIMRVKVLSTTIYY